MMSSCSIVILLVQYLLLNCFCSLDQLLLDPAATGKLVTACHQIVLHFAFSFRWGLLKFILVKLFCYLSSSLLFDIWCDTSFSKYENCFAVVF